MKKDTILLNFARTPSEEPLKYSVNIIGDGFMELTSKSRIFGTEIKVFTAHQEKPGVWVNKHGVEFVVVKPDLRRKPYRVTYCGIDGIAVKKFATLGEVQEYVKSQWQGEDYIRGMGDFHNDYGYFELSGLKLTDLGTLSPDGDYVKWDWKALEVSPEHSSSRSR